MKISTIRNNGSTIKIMRKTAVVLFWLAVWQIAYLVVRQEILIVSPAAVFFRLTQLISKAVFWQTAFFSMFRVLQGFILGVLIGTLLAILTTAVPLAYDVFKPLVSMIRATPVASFIILALVWIKSSGVPAFISFLMVLPIVWGNVTEGIKKTDVHLLEMAQVFRFGVFKKIKQIYIPSVTPFFTAACNTSMGLAWKAGIAAEVIGNTKLSIGGQMYNAKIYIETADLFAWTVVVVVLSVLLEKLMARLMQHFLK